MYVGKCELGSGGGGGGVRRCLAIHTGYITLRRCTQAKKKTGWESAGAALHLSHNQKVTSNTGLKLVQSYPPT